MNGVVQASGAALAGGAGFTSWFTGRGKKDAEEQEKDDNSMTVEEKGEKMIAEGSVDCESIEYGEDCNCKSYHKDGSSMVIHE